MTRREEIQKQIAALREEESQILNAERQRENEPLIGKCFVFRNGYGDQEPDRWNLYCKILGQRDGQLTGLQFQTDYRGDISIDPDTQIPSSTMEREIPVAEFDAAWAKLVGQINDLNRGTEQEEMQAIADEWKAARDVIANYLAPRFVTNANTSAEAILARLASHVPPILLKMERS